uniref:Uncharacterized protein AlNc14C54G4160 n=1 Tax=Albugo laibachii Nc14 TaxID=890382 RepID=F0WBX2_9STRA|nr:conserved hypothetical protein [Albugo laibachii Nc14]|eukprot:CCA18651.1 conserved hypothetical protein [Albugo laibachii Nc14]
MSTCCIVPTLERTESITLLPPPPPPRQRRASAWNRCDEAVARKAPTSTTTCQVCEQSIVKDNWQLGLMFLHTDGFMLMEWYHLSCSKCIPAGGLDNILERAQADMSADVLADFQIAVSKVFGTNELDLIGRAA